MGRWADQDSDSERLPEGFQRIGYDADDGVYYFIESHTGKYYQSAPGNRYGVLRPTSWRPSSPPPTTPAELEAVDEQMKQGNREAVRLMLPFALLVLCVLLLLFKFVSSGVGEETDVRSQSQTQCAHGFETIQIKKGETCWSTGEAYGLGVEELLAVDGNEEIDCDKLQVGQLICVPEDEDA